MGKDLSPNPTRSAYRRPITFRPPVLIRLALQTRSFGSTTCRFARPRRHPTGRWMLIRLSGSLLTCMRNRRRLELEWIERIEAQSRVRARRRKRGAKHSGWRTQKLSLMVSCKLEDPLVTRDCLVIMPFSRGYKEIFDHAIKPACDGTGFRCLRADYPIKAGSIIEHTIDLIFEADVVVADLSSLNANVFYELGVAHALAACGENRCLSGS